MPQWFGKDKDWDDVRRIATGIDVRKRVGAGHDPVTLTAEAEVVLDIGIGDTPQEIGLDTQGANTVFAGPVAGVDDYPIFRLLVADDIGGILPVPLNQNEMLIADATPEWALLAAPAAQHQHLETGAAPFTPAWVNNLTMADNAWIGLGAAAGRLIFDLTPNPDQLQLASADLYLPASHGIIHADSVAAGRILRADGTRYIPADPATTMPIAPVAQGDLIIADATPAWLILTLGAAAGYALVTTATTAEWNQTPTWTGTHTFTAANAIEIDRVVGDPVIIFDTGGADRFTLGVDDSDLDKFKINSGATLSNPSDFELDSSGNVEIAGDFNLLTGKGIVHADGVVAGYVLRADGTRYVPANPATTLPLAPVAQGDLIIANVTPAWSILTLGAAAGYALITTATTAEWDQTPVWTGDHTWDDGVGDSPAVKFVGGSNDDTISIFLDDSGTANNSDLVIRLCSIDDDSKLNIEDSGGNVQIALAANGDFGIGTEDVPHGGVGWATVAIEGANNSSAGPHMQFTTATDNYPLIQILPLIHDNISILFDAYYDGAAKSSDAGSNFLMFKNSDTLQFRCDSGIAAGNAITWNIAMSIDAVTANVSIGTTLVSGELFVDQASTTAAEPVLSLAQRDVSEEVIRISSSAAAGVLTQALVDEGDQASETRTGWFKVYVIDDGNQIADGPYHVPFYTLSA